MSDTAKSFPEKDYRKPCTLCATPRDVLIRCQIDESGTWHFVCPGSCWRRVSGGIIDGDRSDEHKFYRYGGTWKNKHEGTSGKKPKKKKKKSVTSAGESTAEETAEEHEHAEPPAPQSQSGPLGNVTEWDSGGKKYTRNDKIRWNGELYKCRQGHFSDEEWTPGRSYSLWKQES